MSNLDTAADQLVDDYLRRLEEVTASLSPAARSDLLTQIAEHISEARLNLAPRDTAAVQQILEQLGTPEQIAGAADDSGVLPVGRSASEKLYDRITVLLLAFGGLPVLGWFVGLVLLWNGARWTLRDRILGTLVLPLGPAGIIPMSSLLLPFSKSICVEYPDRAKTCEPVSPHIAGWLSLTILGLYVVAGASMCFYLAARVRRFDRAHDPHRRA